MQPLPVQVYGSATCEDTALARDRLDALKVPYVYHSKEDDPRVNELLVKWNKGQAVTPTIVLGDDAAMVAEPSIEELEGVLTQAGYALQPPQAVEILDNRKNQRMPNFTLPAANGENVTLFQLPGRKRPVLFFAHAADERVCQGYARQLTQLRALYEEYNALPLLILPDDVARLAAWAHEFANGYPVLADVGGQVKQKYASALSADPNKVLLVILDAYCAPRAYASAADAGGLIAPSEIVNWLRLMDCECDE